MTALVWIGIVLTLIGLAGLIWCIQQAMVARRKFTDDAQLRARLAKLVAWNLGALAVAGIGLMVCVTGVILG